MWFDLVFESLCEGLISRRRARKAGGGTVGALMVVRKGGKKKKKEGSVKEGRGKVDRGGIYTKWWMMGWEDTIVSTLRVGCLITFTKVADGSS